jgi:hypothetical protein
MSTLTGIGLAVAAVGAGLYVWYKHLKRGRDEMNKINDDATGLGKVFGFSPRENIVRDDKGAVQKSEAALVEKLNEEYPRLASYIRAAKGEQEEFNRAATQGFKAYNAGASADKAREVVRTALMAAGREAKEADAIILKFGFDPTQVKQQVANMRTVIRGVDSDKSFFEERNPFGDFGEGAAKQAGKQAGTLISGLVQEGDVAQANKLFKQIVADFNTEMSKIESDKVRETMRRKWVEALQQSMGADKKEIEKLLNELTYGTQDPGEMNENLLIDKNRNLAAKELLGTNSTIAAALRRQAEEAQRLLLIDQARKNASAQGNGRLSEALSLLTKGKQMTGLQLNELNKFIGPENKRNATQKAIAALMRQQALELGGLVTGEGAANSAAQQRLSTQKKILEALGAQKGQTPRQAIMAQIPQMYQDSMTSAWQSVGQMMSSDIDRQFQGQMDSLSASHQAASAAMQRRHQAASNALQARHTKQSNALQRAQDRAQQALDDKWKKRKKALQDEEDTRQRMFENELNRIERMKEMKNLNTDYKVAVESGNLDEAAKIRNEATANQDTWALQDADSLAKAAFDKEMARIEELEAKEKASLERRQQLQQQHLQARQQREQQAQQVAQQRAQAAMQRQQAAAQANMQRMVELKKAEIQRKLEMDLAYVPRTQAEAEKHIGSMIQKYRGMGINLSKFATLYGKTLQNSLDDNLRKNFNEMESKVKWAALAKSVGNKYTQAIWGKNLKEFLKWIDTQTDTSKVPSGKRNGVDVGKARNSIGGGEGYDAFHRGGMVGTGGTGRVGYAGSNTVMPSEKLILAKRGEGLLNTEAMRRIGPDMLKALNRGEPIIRQDIHTGNVMSRKPRTGGGLMNVGVASNTLGQILNRGTKNVIKQLGDAQKAREAAAAMAGGLVGGKDLMVGGGGWMRPWRRKYGMTQGLHGAGGLDYGVPSGTPLYSPAAGRVAASYDIGGRGGYSSYGRLVRTQHGNKQVLLAHMSSRGVRAGQSLNKGSFLGRSGNTGNSTGPHVHIEARSAGRVVDPRRLFGANGVSLRRGGELQYDNTMVNAHKGETMLTKPLSQKMKEAVDVARTDTKRYYRDINVTVEGGMNATGRELALEIKKELEYEESRY